MVERVSIFIDGSNFYHRLANLGIREIDLKKLLDLLCGPKRKISNVYYCDANFKQQKNPGMYAHQMGWFNKVKTIPNLNFKLYGRNDKNTVKGDDIHLAVEMVKEAYENTYDTAILVTGDGDFKRAVEVVIGRGKKVENAYFAFSRSNSLNFVPGIEMDYLACQCMLVIY
ncbi:MAG TPA: NYN domain-containing protein [Candidatus Baltobacteraceae bacterium]|nr:NYN domain-containing protein [Candidatus Baltobacteraceae bacterium]